MSPPTTVETLGPPLPAPPPARLPPNQFGRAALLTALVAVIGLIAVATLSGLARARRRRRLAALESRPPARPAIDVWQEAGRRVEIPTPEALEDDRLNLDDTNFPNDMDGPADDDDGPFGGEGWRPPEEDDTPGDDKDPPRKGPPKPPRRPPPPRGRR